MKRRCAAAASPANRCCRFWKRAWTTWFFTSVLRNTRAAARQMVCHGHIKVNGRKVNIPSYALKVNDVIEVKNHNVSRQLATKNLEVATSRAVPDWMSLNKEEFKGTVMRIPTRDEIQPIANEQAVVEFYSR